MNQKTIVVSFQYQDLSNCTKTKCRVMSVNENVAKHLLDDNSPKYPVYHDLVLGSIQSQVLLLYEGLPNSTVILSIKDQM